MGRSILLVCHFYPPSSGAGVHRPVTMARELRRRGHRVTILTTSAYGERPQDADEDVHRSYDLQLLHARLKGRRHAGGILEGDTYTNRPHPVSYVLVPEAMVVTWAPFAVLAALRLHRRRRFDCVITTAPPESGHLVGRALRARGVPWIADVRDGWIFESYRPRYPTRLQRRLDVALERRLMRAADVVTAVAEPLVQDLRERVGGNAVLVPNGWDPELFGDVDGVEAARELLDPDRVSLVYTGRLAVVDRDPRPLVDALRTLARDQPEVAARLELVFAGSYTNEELELFASDVSPGRIVVTGNLERRVALALQREAQGLLLITAGTRRHEVTGKVFEYLGAGAPILALAEGTEAARIVREAQAGLAVGTHKVSAIADALRRFAAGEVEPPPEERRRAYAYPAVSDRMAEQVERLSGADDAA